MLRIRYNKTKFGYVTDKFLISDVFKPIIEINNDAELFIKNAGITVYYEQCTNVRNAKYRARKKIEEFGYVVLTEMRKKRK
jgi:hypothetical protein